MIVCPSIAPRSMREAVRQLHRFSASHNLVELRIDAIEDLDLERLLASRRPRLIVTNRSQSEGGAFSGTIRQHVALMSQAQFLGAEYVDMDYRHGKRYIAAMTERNNVILSYHNFKQTPRNLLSIYRDMKHHGTGIIKISVLARDISDNRTIFNLLVRAKKERKKTIAHCMGERGEISRILAGKFGGFLSYAAASQKQCTGPGQLPVELMEKTFHAHQINYRTKIFGLIGNPVRQSKGVYYHNPVFQKKKVNAVYLNFLVDDIDTFFRSFSTLLQGASVTMPFKESIIPLLDRVDETCRTLSSVNTIVSRRGSWYGTNTDLPALLDILRRRTRLKGKRVLIIGTGAMARTMIFAMSRAGAIPILAGRSASKVQELAKRFNCGWVLPDEYIHAGAEIVMNATSVGMAGQPQNPILPHSVFKRSALAFDAVNRPTLTPFLSAARKAGCKIITGSELFHEQAKLQSRIFLNALS